MGKRKSNLSGGDTIRKLILIYLVIILLVGCGGGQNETPLTVPAETPTDLATPTDIETPLTVPAETPTDLATPTDIETPTDLATPTELTTEQTTKLTTTAKANNGLTLIGNYTLTYYCHCSKCCGKSNGITATGAKVQEGVTVASNSIPLGTRIYINGLGWRIVQDRGGMASNVLDVYVSSHEKALQLGRRKGVAVYKESK